MNSSCYVISYTNPSIRFPPKILSDISYTRMVKFQCNSQSANKDSSSFSTQWTTIGNSESSMLSFFDLIFKDDIPLQILCKREVQREDISPYDIPGCIMNDVINKMSMKLIDFDPGYYANEILQSSRIAPDPRDKPFYATVKGMGGGKTRVFEDIRRELLLEDGVLPIAITFNSHWSTCNYLDNWNDIVGKNLVSAFALSVVSRMACMFYDIKIRDMVNRIKRSLPSQYIDAATIMHGFIHHMVKKLSIYRPVDTFILLMDETMQIDRHFGSLGISSDIWRALLSTGIIINGSVLNVGLVVSSLSISPLGMTSSGRLLNFIKIPNNLNVSQIVNDVWHFENIDRTSDEYFQLQLVAALVNSVPRLVEYGKTALQDVLTIRKKGNPTATLTKGDIRTAVESIIEAVRVRYRIDQPSNELLTAIIFGEEVSLKSMEVIDAIISSIITNSIQPFGIDGYKVKSVETSLLMLIAIPYGSDRKVMRSGFQAMLEAITGFGVDQAGLILEVIAYEWMKIRVSIIIASRKRFSLAKLLGISDERVNEVISLKYRNILRTEILTNYPQIIELDALATMDTLDEIEVMDDSHVVIIKPFRGERWDICLKTNLPSQSTPFYTFIELKSVDENETNSNKITKLVEGKITLEKFPKNGTLYNATNMIMKNSSNFIYIYMNTYNSESFFLDKISCLNREDTFRFLGPLIPLYQVARSANPGPLQSPVNQTIVV
eukprot:gene300-537_t